MLITLILILCKCYSGNVTLSPLADFVQDSMPISSYAIDKAELGLAIFFTFLLYFKQKINITEINKTNVKSLIELTTITIFFFLKIKYYFRILTIDHKQRVSKRYHRSRYKTKENKKEMQF